MSKEAFYSSNAMSNANSKKENAHITILLFNTEICGYALYSNSTIY